MNLPTAVVDVLRPWEFPGKWRLLSPLVPSTGDVSAKLYGYRTTFDLADHIQRSMYLGAFERTTTAAVRSIIGKGMAFMDVGANAGYYTLLGARIVGPTGRVVAVEPSPWVGQRLAQTIERNPMPHVSLHQVGLGDKPGHFPLPSPPVGNHTPSFHDPRTDCPINLVPVVALDDVIDEWFPPGMPIALMKADIEGSELGMLRGGSRLFASGRVRQILIEENDSLLAQAGGTIAELRDLLGSFGYDLVRTMADGMALWAHRRAGGSPKAGAT